MCRTALRVQWVSVLLVATLMWTWEEAVAMAQAYLVPDLLAAECPSNR